MRAFPRLAQVAAVSLATTLAHAGIISGQGSAAIGGASRPYTTWDIYQDVAGGFTLPFEGVPFGMTFHDNRLYIANRGELLYGPGFHYTPGPAANLAVATEMRTTGMASNDPRRFIESGAMTFNTSGSGYGWGAAGQSGLTGLGRLPNAPSGNVSYTITPAGPDWTIGPTATMSFARDMDYISSTDRFALLDTFSFPAVRVTLHPHTVDGLGAQAAAFNVLTNAMAAQPVSGAFASHIIGQNVAESQVLLVAGSPALLGSSTQIELAIYSLFGQQLGQTQTIPTIGVPLIKSIAVDEARGQLYIGGVSQFTGGYITTITIPAPATIALPLLAAAFAARRRR
jgi:hypothetical protein